MKKLEHIDALRGLTILAVCIYHFYYYFFPEETFKIETYSLTEFLAKMVYLFFIISGFVIPLSLSKSQYGLKDFGAFFAKRFVRISIPFYLSLAIISFYLYFGHAFFNWELKLSWKQLLSNVFFVADFTGEEWINPIFWTLGIEMQYYLFVGLLFPLLEKLPKTYFLLLLAILSLSGVWIPNLGVFLHYNHFFALGFVLFLFLENRVSWSVLLVFLLGESVISYVVDQSLFVPIITIVGTLYLVFMKQKIPFLNLFGKISFSLYLLHGFVGGVLILLLKHLGSMHWSLNLLIMLIVASAVSFGLYYLVEKPSQKLSQKINFKRT